MGMPLMKNKRLEAYEDGIRDLIRYLRQVDKGIVDEIANKLEDVPDFPEGGGIWFTGKRAQVFVDVKRIVKDEIGWVNTLDTIKNN